MNLNSYAYFKNSKIVVYIILKGNIYISIYYMKDVKKNYY